MTSESISGPSLTAPHRNLAIPSAAILCAHAGAIALDANLLLAANVDDAFCFLATLAILHVDVVLLAIWATRAMNRMLRVLLCGSLCSVAAALAVFSLGGSESPVLSGFCQLQTGLAIIQTLLGFPMIVLLFYGYHNGARREWFWVLAAFLLLGFAAVAGFTGTLANHRWSNPIWIERIWSPDEYLLRALTIFVVNLTAIFWCAAILESLTERKLAAQWLTWITICVAIVLVTSWAIGGNLNRVSWSIFGPPPTWTRQWLNTLATPLSIPLVSAMAMAGIAGLLQAGQERAATSPADSRETAEYPRRERNDLRFSTSARLIGWALLLSTLNLFVGFIQGWFPIHGYQFGNQGLFREILFVAPHGLWAAQAALSAVFFQSSFLNVWKRMLVVLAWAELSMVAYWGQVGLANWMRAGPSNFVTAMFHCAASGIVIGAAGILLGSYLRKPPVRVACDRLGSGAIASTRRSLLSLSDLITIVTAFAAISYPISVVFTFELWRSHYELGWLTLKSLPWILAASGATAIAVTSWLEDGKPSYWRAAISGALLVGCAGHDWASFTGFFSEQFFELRHGYRLITLPAWFLATAIGALGLKRCGFRVVLLPQISTLSAPLDSQARGASLPPPSPWD